MAIFQRRHTSSTIATEKTSESTLVPRKRTFFPRLIFSLIYLISFIFLILVEIGNINKRPVIRSTYFLRIDLSNIIPNTVPNAVLINSVARTIGLHDFYQVGVWGFCEGYNDEGITDCSKPETLYWFNPVDILLNELLSGASIALPTELTMYLNIVRKVSYWMFSLFLVTTILNFLMICISPVIISSHQRYVHRGRRIFFRSIPLTILTFISALFTAVPTVIATAMFYILKSVITSQSDLNIGAKMGTRMLVFMWVPTALNLIGFIWALGNFFAVCCCSGKRQAKREGLIDDHGHPVAGESGTTKDAPGNGTRGKEKLEGEGYGNASTGRYASVMSKRFGR